MAELEAIQKLESTMEALQQELNSLKKKQGIMTTKFPSIPKKVNNGEFPKKARLSAEAYRKKNIRKARSIGYKLIAVVKAGKSFPLKKLSWTEGKPSVLPEQEVLFKTQRAIVRKTYKKHEDVQSDIALYY